MRLEPRCLSNSPAVLSWDRGITRGAEVAAATAAPTAPIPEHESTALDVGDSGAWTEVDAANCDVKLSRYCLEARIPMRELHRDPSAEAVRRAFRMPNAPVGWGYVYPNLCT